MNKNKLILSALSMDLKRLAIATFRGSFVMASKFKEETRKRRNEVNINELEPYMKNVLSKISILLSSYDQDRIAEDGLMYSTIIQNYVLFK